MSDLKIGSLEAVAGEKIHGSLLVEKRGDGTDIQIPLGVFKGINEGPVLFVSAGVHGDEYAGVEAIRKISKELNPAEMNGTLITSPVLNVPAYLEGTRCSPLDGENLARIFPGKKNGNTSQKIAYTVFNEIIPKCTHVIDLHAGGSHYYFYPCANYRGNLPISEKCRELAEVLGFEIVLKNIPWVPSRLDSEAAKMGIPSISPECGGDARCMPKDVQLYKRGIMNVLKYLKMIDGEPDIHKHIKYVSSEIGGDSQTRVNATTNGFGTSYIEPGEDVSENQLIYEISDLNGKVVESLKAPCDGVVFVLRTYPRIRSGDMIFNVVKYINYNKEI